MANLETGRIGYGQLRLASGQPEFRKKTRKEALKRAFRNSKYITPFLLSLEKRIPPMTADKILEAVAIYKRYFEVNGFEKRTNLDHSCIEYSRASMMEHCHGMLDEMEKMVAEENMEKAFRWLGFIQGVLWSKSAYSLAELKSHNRS